MQGDQPLKGKKDYQIASPNPIISLGFLMPCFILKSSSPAVYAFTALFSVCHNFGA